MKVLFVLAVIVPVIAVFSTAFLAIRKRMKGENPKRAIRANLVTVVALAICLIGCGVGAYAAGSTPDATPEIVASQDAEKDVAQAPAEEKSGVTDRGLQYIAAGISTGIGAIGGGLAVAAGAPAAIGAATEDPKSFGKSIIFVALGESIALYGVVVSILILYA